MRSPLLKATLLAFALFSISDAAFAISYTSIGTGNWNAPLTWTPAGVPGAADDVTIAANTIVSVTDSRSVTAVTFQAGASTGLDARLNVTGTGNLSVGTGGIVINAGVNGAISEMFISGAVSSTGDVTFSGTSTNAQIHFDLSGTPTLTLAGNLGGGGSILTGNNGTIILNGSVNQTLPATTYGGLAVNNPSGASIAGATTVNGPLTVGPSCTLVVSSGALTINGDAAISGTIQAPAGGIAFTGIGSISGSGGIVAGSQVLFDVGSRTITASTLEVLGPALVEGSVQNDGSIRFDGNVSGLGSWMQGVGSVLVIGGSFTPSSFSANAAPNAVYFDGGAQTIPLPTGGSPAYHNLVVTGTGNKSFASSVNIDGSLTIDGGVTLNVPSTDLTVFGNVNVQWGSIAGSTGALVLNGPGGVVTGCSTCSITATVDVLSAKTFSTQPGFAVTGTIELGASGVLINAADLEVNNVTGTGAGSTWVQSGTSSVIINGSFLALGTLDADDSGNVVVYGAAGPQTVKAATYSVLRLVNAGFKDMTGVSTIQSIFEISGTVSTTLTGNLSVGDGGMSITSAAAIDLGAFTHSIAGTTHIPNTTNTSATTLNFNGSGPPQLVSIGGPVKTITMSGTAPKVASNAWTILEDFAITSAGTPLNGANFNHQVGGDWFRVGGTVSNFYVTFNGGTGAQTIDPTTFAEITFSGAALKTANGDLSAQDWIIQSGATFNAGTFQHTVLGSFVNGGVLQQGTSTFFFTGPSPKFIGGTVATTFHHLILSTVSTLTNSTAVTINGNLELLFGGFVATGADVLVRGNVTGGGGFTGRMELAGAAPQTWTNSGANFTNLVVSTSGGVIFDADASVSALFNLTGGNVTMVPGRVLTIAAAAVNNRSTGHVEGEMALGFDASQTRTFHVGAGSVYSPVDVVSGAAADVIRLKAVDSPAPAAGSNALSRRWDVASGGTPATMRFYYDPTDVVGNETSYVGARHTGTWTRFPGTVDPANNWITVASQSAVGTWTAGEAAALGEPHWINPAGGNWNTPSNWSGGAVPAPSDNVFIDLDGNYTVTLDVSATVAGLQLGAATGTQTLQINSPQTLTLDGPSLINARGVLTLIGGGIAGTGTLTNDGAINWNGFLGGSGTLINNSQINLAGINHNLNGKTITNNASMVWSGTGDIALLNGAVINNASLGTFTINNDRQITASGGGSFTNTGTITKAVGTGITLIVGTVAFDSAGTIDITSGILDIQSTAANVSGTLNMASTAELKFGPGADVNVGSLTISPTGRLNLQGGRANVNGSVDFPRVVMNGGIFSGSNSFTIVDLDWRGGLFLGPAQRTITGTLTMGGAGGGLLIDGGTVEVNGPATWTADSMSIANGGQLWIAGTTLQVSHDPVVTNGGGGGSLRIDGTLRKNGGAGSMSLGSGVALNVTGTVDLLTGTIVAGGGGTSSGALQLGSSTNFAVFNSPYTFATGTTVTGAGKVSIDNATLTLSTNVAFPNLELRALGVLGGTADASVAGQFVWADGSLAGPSTSTLTLNGNTQINGLFVSSDGRAIVNTGTLVWSSSDAIGLGNGARIDNTATGVFRISNDRSVMHMGGAAASFNNLGLVEKTSTGNTLFQNVALNNDGRLLVRRGVVRASGGFAQSSGGTLEILLGGITAGSQYGQLEASLPTLDGTIQVALDGFAPSPGNTFRLISIAGGAHHGDFATRNYPTGGGLTFTDAYDSGGLLLTANSAAPSLVVTTLADSGAGSLRAAITEVQGGRCAAPCTITFNVPTPGSIDILSALPSANATYTIDGTTQPGYAGVPLIGVNGAACTGCEGINLEDGSRIAGLALFNFTGGGAVWLEGVSGGNTLENSWIGQDLSGAPAPNLVGVIIDGAGTNRVLNNVISNNSFGVYMFNGSNTNTVMNNVFVDNGTSAVNIADGAGNNVLSNSISGSTIGIDLNEDGPSANDIGDADTGANNTQNTPVISSATLSGGVATVVVSADGSPVTQSMQVQFFQSDGLGSGRTLVHEQCFAGNVVNNATVNFARGPLNGGDDVVATTTSWSSLGCAGSRGDGTSEFSVAAGVICTPATVSITAPTSTCPGATASATATLVPSAIYTWTITNGTIVSGAGTNTITFSAGTSGSISLDLTVTNDCGAVTMARAVVPIAAVSAAITASGPTTFCPGGSVTLTANAGTTGETYLWSTGATSQSITVNVAGDYTVTATNASGCSATSAPTRVTVNATASPTITPSGPTTFCPGGSVTLTASAGATYLWSNGATTQSIVVTASGNYSVTVVDAAGCSGTSAPTTVTVTTAPTPVITPSGPTTFCPGGSVTLTASAGATYLWSNGATTQSIVVTAAGSYSVTVSDGAGCSGTSAPTTVTVTSGPAAVITTSGPTSFCAGGSVTLTANAGATGQGYLWSNGATTQSINVSAAGAYTVTVTEAGCSTTSTPVVVVQNAPPSVTISGPTFICQSGSPVRLTASGSNIVSLQWSTNSTDSFIDVTPSTTTTYTVTARSADGCTTTASHTVSVGSGASALAVVAPANVFASSTGNVASVIGGGSGSYTWSLINGTITEGQGTPSIKFTAGASGPITVLVTFDDGSGCVANGTATVAIGACATVPASLLSPDDNANISGSATFSWTAVAGATRYEVWRRDNGSPSFLGSANAPATTVTLPVSSGTFSWYVVAFLPQACSPSTLTSGERTLTISAGANCPSVQPRLLLPANGAVAFSPVKFDWEGVPNAIGYRVMASLGGLPAVSIDETNESTTELTATVPIGPVRWWVEALYGGCDPVRSLEQTFTVAVEDCESHRAAQLKSPPDGTTVTSSAVEFEWSAVEGADGYAVWTKIGSDEVVIGSTVGALKLTAVVPPGRREWWVETKFEGCPSTFSERWVVNVPSSSNCTTQRPSLELPSDGATFTTPRVDLVWSAVPNAVLYEVWLSVNGGSDALVATSTSTNVSIDVPAGEISWFVRARINGCPDDRDSVRRTFRFAPPAACSTSIPIVLLPFDDGRPVTSPTTFGWTAVPGATEYKVYLIRGGDRELIATSRSNAARDVVVPNGESRWLVEATFNGCPPTQSSEGRFVAVPDPPSCIELAPPVISLPGQVSANASYSVQWSAVPGAESYLLTEFIGSASRTYAVSGQSAAFSYPNATSSAQTYVYHVRGVDNDCTPAQEGPISAALGVTILPARSIEGSTVIGAQATVAQVVNIGPEFAGRSFQVVALQPWITVQPSSGVVPAGGIDLNVAADLTTLPLGTSVAGLQIAFGSTGASRLETNSGNSTNTSISVNLVTPVTATPKSAPGPDALIIPAVAHAQGVNAQFQSDVRVSNTSAQVMRYQLTFVPTGEAGIAQGRQTTIDIEPGRTIALDDILRTWFGTGNANVLGTLEIRPLTQAASSTSNAATRGISNLVTFASSRTFNSTPNGTFGTYIPAIPFANFVARATGTAQPQILSLQQIAQSDSYRTNLGIVEGSGNPAEVLISVFNSGGARVAQFPLQLTGGQHLQVGSFLAQRGITLSDGRVQAQVISGSGKVTAYAAVVNNATGDSLVVTPVTLGQSTTNKYVLPGVAELSSGTPWQTDMRLLNAGEQAVTATLTLQSLSNATPQTATMEIAPGETKQLDRVLATLFGVSNDGGALHITTPSNSNLIATARTYRPSADGGNFGQFIQAVTPNEAIGFGARPLQILQVEESQRFRSNIGLAEVSGKPAKVEVTVIPPDAKVSAKIEVDLAANQFRQLNSLLSAIGFESTHNARVTVRVMSGEGRVTAYAATIDQVTQDPTFIPAQ